MRHEFFREGIDLSQLNTDFSLNQSLRAAKPVVAVRAALLVGGLALVLKGSGPKPGECTLVSSTFNTPDRICSTENNYTRIDPKKAVKGVCYEDGHAFATFSCELHQETQP